MPMRNSLAGSNKPPEADRLADAARQAFAAGDLATTETLCRQLAAVSPRDARPWHLLAEAALKRNRLDVALASADRAVALGPFDPAAQLMRARCRALAGDHPGAIGAAEATLAIKLLSPEALDGLGAVFSLLGRHDRALDLFRRAVAADPRRAQFVFNLAASERMAGQFEQAEAHCDRATRLDPHLYIAHYLRADLRTQTRERNHVALMESLLAQGVRGWPGEVMLRYALGKEYEDLGEYGRAFGHVAAAAALHRRQFRYDIDAAVAAIDETIRDQSAERFADAPGGHTAAAPVFVVGLARSGTTLVERILASHPDFVSAGETGRFGPLSMRQDAAPLGAAYLDSIGTLGLPAGKRIIDKTLQNYLLCGRILDALPNARIIALNRRPMDLGWALFKTLFAGPFAFSYELTELAAYLLAFRRLMQHWRAALPASAYLEIDYEAIVADQEGTSRRIIEFVGAEWADSVLRLDGLVTPSATASAVQVRQPIHAASVGKWRHYAAQLEPLRAALAAEIPEAELV